MEYKHRFNRGLLLKAMSSWNLGPILVKENIYSEVSKMSPNFSPHPPLTNVACVALNELFITLDHI